MSGKTTRVTKVPRPAGRARDAHKGDFGRVLVVAGATGYAGAGSLTAMGALRAGAGLVSLLVPERIYEVAAGFNPCVMTYPARNCADHFSADALVEVGGLLASANVLATGPGLGRADETGEFVRALLQSAAEIPLVLDADGLWAVKGDPAILKRRTAATVLTPHPGEMSYLTGLEVSVVQRDREAAAVELAHRTGAVVALKGAGTVVTDGKRVYVNGTGNPGMATAGSGDVLTGVIAALVGQGMEAFDASALGVHVHGLAGDLAAGELGEISLTATDILDRLAGAFRKYARRTSRR